MKKYNAQDAIKICKKRHPGNCGVLAIHFQLDGFKPIWKIDLVHEKGYVEGGWYSDIIPAKWLGILPETILVMMVGISLFIWWPFSLWVLGFIIWGIIIACF